MLRDERLRIALMLAPALFVIIVLFGGGLAYGFLQSLGWNPRIGTTEISLSAYSDLLFSEQYAEVFWTGLALTLWISLASTVISAVLAVGAALLVYHTRRGQQLAAFLLQFNLPVPHLVAGIGVLFVLSQSGLISRAGAQIGWFGSAGDFPILVRDRYGIGIIITYVWKEVPFIGVIVLAVLRSLGEDYQASARTLGANTWQRFRYVTLPLIAPALLSASTIVFVFTFGAYEVPEILGVRFPRALPVTAYRFYIDADLNARAQAMATSMIIALVAMLFVSVYWYISRRDSTR